QAAAERWSVIPGQGGNTPSPTASTKWEPGKGKGKRIGPRTVPRLRSIQKRNALGLRTAAPRDALSQSRGAIVYSHQVKSPEELFMTSPSRRNGSPRTEPGKATEIPRRKQAQTLRHASSRTKQGEATGFSRSEHTHNGGYNHDDPSLRAGEGGLTIW